VSATTAGDFYDTLEIIIQYPLCEDTINIPLRVRIIDDSGEKNNFEIFILNHYNIDTRSTDYEIPVYILSDNSIGGGKIDTMEITMYNGRSLFYPKRVDNGGHLTAQVVEQHRLLTITDINIPLLKLGGYPTILFNIIGDVMLGDTTETSISIDKIIFNSSVNVGSVETRGGVLSIEICEEGGSRLLGVIGNIESQIINPITTSHLEVICKVSNKGTHWLEIVDNNGHTQILKE
jgi:hypothetical protein